MGFLDQFRVLKRGALAVGFLTALGGSMLSAEMKTDWEQGRKLSLKYCTTCHVWPSPDLLDQRTWREGAEPLMRKLLGMAQLDPTKPGDSVVLTEWNARCQPPWTERELSEKIRSARRNGREPIGGLL